MNAPKLRFKEFNDEWDYEKLNYYVERITRKNKNNESSLVLTISAQYGLVDQCKFFNRNVSSSDLSNYCLLYNGDFAYNKSYSNGYPWGAVKRLNLYDKGVVSSLYICFRNNENIVSNFLQQYFETTKWYNQLSEISVEGARNHGLLNIAVNDFFNTEHFFPSKNEQEKIGTFLSLLDKKIELQSKKIEALKLYKMCIKKVVFKDRKTWESKNIFEVLDFEQPNKYLVYSEDYIDDKTMIPVLTANKGFILGYCNEDNYYNKGDSIIFDDFTMDMKYTTFPYKIKSSAIKILTPKNNNNLKFLYESLLSLNLSSEEHKRHYISIVQNMVIQVPNIDIQNKVAKILSTYDKKIEQEKLKFEKLKSLKKGLIQNMFI